VIKVNAKNKAAKEKKSQVKVRDLKPGKDTRGGSKNKTDQQYMTVKLNEATISNYGN
jgi:hypothetical protein